MAENYYLQKYTQEPFHPPMALPPEPAPDAPPAGTGNYYTDTYGAPEFKAPEPSQEDFEDPTWGDYGRMVLAGGVQLGGGLGWLAKKFGIESGGDLQEASYKKAGSIMEGLTEDARNALAVEFTSRDEGELWTDRKWRKAKLIAAQSLLGTAAGMGIGSILTKGLAAAGMTKAATTAAGAVVQAPTRTAGAIGYGLGEAGVAAPAVGAQVESQIMEMSHEQLYEQAADYRAIYESLENKDPAMKAQRAKELLAKAAAGDAAALALVSTFVLSAPLGAVVGGYAGKFPIASTRPRSIATAGGGEATQEFLQSGAEKIAENIGMRQADPSIPLTQGALEESVGGALAGGMMGVGPGAIAPLEAPTSPEQDDLSKQLNESVTDEELDAMAGETGGERPDVLSMQAAMMSQAKDRLQTQQYTELSRKRAESDQAEALAGTVAEEEIRENERRAAGFIEAETARDARIAANRREAEYQQELQKGEEAAQIAPYETPETTPATEPSKAVTAEPLKNTAMADALKKAGVKTAPVEAAPAAAVEAAPTKTPAKVDRTTTPMHKMLSKRVTDAVAQGKPVKEIKRLQKILLDYEGNEAAEPVTETPAAPTAPAVETPVSSELVALQDEEAEAQKAFDEKGGLSARRRLVKATAAVENFKPAASVLPEKMTIEQLDAIADPNVPIEKMEQQESRYLDNLEKQIKAEGITSPIRVMTKEGAPKIIDDGMHRLAVMRRLGLKEAPVEYVDEKEVFKRTLAEDMGLQNLETAAHEAATSPKNDLPQPTEGQKEAGNYKKGHIKVAGLDVTIENPVGSTRRGAKIKDHYGYIKRTEGADGDQVDTFVNPKIADDFTGSVYVIDQTTEDKTTFDEHKVMLGYKSKIDAIRGYKRNYDKGWHVGPVTEMSQDEFKTWLAGPTKTPVHLKRTRATRKFVQGKDGQWRYSLPRARKALVEDAQNVVPGVDANWVKAVVGEPTEDKGAIEALQQESTTAIKTAPMTKAAVDTAIAPLVNEFTALDVTVYESEAAMPKGRLKDLLAKRSGPKLIAFYDILENKVHLFADRVKSADRAVEAVLHEGVAHQGLRALFSKTAPSGTVVTDVKALNALLDDVYKNATNKKLMAELKKIYWLDKRGKTANEQILAEEYIARIAESGAQPKLLQRVIAAVRRQLRKLGLARDWTDNDINSLLMETRSALRKQGKALEDVVLTESVKVAETGEEFDIETNAAVALRQHDKRTEVVRKLRNCL